MEHHMKGKAGPILDTGISNIHKEMTANSPSFRGGAPSSGGHPFQEQSGHHSPNTTDFHSNHSSHEMRVKKGHP